MARLIDPFEQFFDKNGNLLVGGSIRFLESGSATVEKTTYSDFSQTIANPNPVPLKGDARAPDIYGDGTYRAVVYDANLVQVEVKDPIGATQTTAYGSTWLEGQIYTPLDVVREDSQYWQGQSSGNKGNRPSLDTGANWLDITNPVIEVTSTNGIQTTRPTPLSLNIEGSRTPTQQVFGDLGAGLWTKPSGCRFIYIVFQGAGAAGGPTSNGPFIARCGGGGGSGGQIFGWIDVTSISTVPLSIGAGGEFVTTAVGEDGQGSFFGGEQIFGGGGGLPGTSLPVTGTLSGKGGSFILSGTFPMLNGVNGNDGGPPANNTGVLSGFGAGSRFGGSIAPIYGANAFGAVVRGSGGPGGADISGVAYFEGGDGAPAVLTITEFY